MKVKEQFNKKLLVEGNDDQHVMLALCEKFKISEDFDIIDSGGIDNLLLQIPLKLKQLSISTIAVIIDADLDIKSRWTSLSNLLAPLRIVDRISLRRSMKIRCLNSFKR
jgi:hypothetical protein